MQGARADIFSHLCRISGAMPLDFLYTFNVFCSMCTQAGIKMNIGLCTLETPSQLTTFWDRNIFSIMWQVWQQIIARSISEEIGNFPSIASIKVVMKYKTWEGGRERERERERGREREKERVRERDTHTHRRTDDRCTCLRRLKYTRNLGHKQRRKEKGNRRSEVRTLFLK